MKMGRLAALAVLAALVVAGCGGRGGSAATASGTGASEPAQRGSEPAASEVAPSETPPSEAAPVVPFAASIDNERHARPQSGLTGARIVIEALAEGGITRYFAIFDRDPGENVGPIRSARIYFNRLSHLWNLPLAHAGANQDAMVDWKRHPLYDVDAIYTNGAAFFRTKDRKAPHNTYTDMASIQRALAGRDIHPTVPAYRLGPSPDNEPAGGVRVDFTSRPEPYSVEWREGLDGRWQRLIDGQPDKDANGQAIEADNVLVVVAPSHPDNDPWTPGSIDIDWTHPGQAWLFRNGRLTQGSWAFTSQAIEMTDTAGRPAGFTAGNLWIEVVPEATVVTVLAGGSQ